VARTPTEQRTARRGGRAARGPRGRQRRAELLAELGLAFRGTFRALSRLRGRDTHLAGGQLSHAQFQLLIELEERGDLPAGELATAAQLAPGTVTQMLDALADSGHVERVRSERDRRVVLTRLTPAGRRQIAAKRAAWQERWEAALEGVSERELAAATKVLRRLAGVFESAPADDCGRGRAGVAERPAAAQEGVQKPRKPLL
jgi:DNA-binding MarR family transcriptional regulator